MTESHDTASDALLQQLQQAVAALPDVPPALERTALGLFRAAPSPLAEAATAAVRLIKAVLTFDSFATSGVALGMRSLPSTTRHLLFASQGRDIDLRISPEAGRFVFAGQILGPDEQGAVELVAGDARLRAELDDLGGFRLDGVGPGTWTMTLALGDDRIELPPLEVGDCRA